MNDITDKQKEILLIAQEECAEVTQAISKVFRFGMEASHNMATNRERLTEEVGDLLCMINLMIEKGVLNDTELNRASIAKRNKLEKWSNIFKPDSPPNLPLRCATYPACILKLSEGSLTVQTPERTLGPEEC